MCDLHNMHMCRSALAIKGVCRNCISRGRGGGGKGRGEEERGERRRMGKV